jgi:hypothetical protein
MTFRLAKSQGFLTTLLMNAAFLFTTCIGQFISSYRKRTTKFPNIFASKRGQKFAIGKVKDFAWVVGESANQVSTNAKTNAEVVFLSRINGFTILPFLFARYIGCAIAGPDTRRRTQRGEAVRLIPSHLTMYGYAERFNKFSRTFLCQALCLLEWDVI